KLATLVPPNLATLNALTAFLPRLPKKYTHPMFCEERNRAKREVVRLSFENVPSEALHQTVLMTVDGTQPKSTDK
ncbi:hypothetical protein CA163_39435, partial [Vibrio parahaemolyticus]